MMIKEPFTPHSTTLATLNIMNGKAMMDGSTIQLTLSGAVQVSHPYVLMVGLLACKKKHTK